MKKNKIRLKEKKNEIIILEDKKQKRKEKMSDANCRFAGWQSYDDV